jgi:hypothetical protein
MKIEIADRLKPFSHAPGHEVLVPGTQVRVKAFPSAFVIWNEQGAKSEYVFGLKGPISPFTVEQDLERREVRIYGEAVQGYFRLTISAKKNVVILFFEKTPECGINIGENTFFSGECLELMKDILVLEGPMEERLFLGSSKKMESEAIRRRKDLREIFPLWHRLGSMTPSIEEGTFSPLEEAIKKKDKQTIYNLFLHAYLAHFSSGFVPRNEDEERQGLSSLEEFSNSLVAKGASYIRSLFFQEKEDGFHILPCLLTLFVCGKFIHLNTRSGCTFNIEWTKHRLRRMSIFIHKDQTLKLHFPSEIKCFRIKTSIKDRGRDYLAKGFELPVLSGDRIYFDVFQK